MACSGSATLKGGSVDGRLKVWENWKRRGEALFILALPWTMPNPKAGRVVSVKVNPADLSTLDAAALAALIADARASMAAERPATTRRPRVSLSDADTAALAAVNWQPPYVDAADEWRPIGSVPSADRACLLAPFYTVVGAALTAGPVHLPDAARVLAAVMGSRENKRSIGSLAQTLANRMQRGIVQKGAVLNLTGTTGAPIPTARSKSVAAV